MADTAKLNNKINENKRKLKNLYMSIGETYNKIFGNEPSEEFSELCQEINNIL